MGAGQVVIRTYEDSDRERVAALWSAVIPNDPPWNEPTEFIRRKRAAQPALFWVAQEGEQIVGTVVAGYDGVRGWIYHLAVAPAKRRQGTARLLRVQMGKPLGSYRSLFTTQRADGIDAAGAPRRNPHGK